LESRRVPFRSHRHAHDFLVLGYVAAGGGPIRVDGRDRRLETGDVLVVAPGEVVTPEAGHELDSGDLWIVFFPPDVVEAGAFRTWRAHPLLLPFVRGVAGGVQRLRVPAAERPGFAEHIAAMDRELRERRDGYDQAVLAHLTLLLVAVSRLAAGAPGDLALRDEPLLAAVFDVIEERFHEPISLKDVAAAVGLTPGHLTTVVGRRTGRTVQQWITERRMSEARRLLAETDLTVAALAARLGYRDAGWLIKKFRDAHRVTPLAWRRAGRP
ncbi:AraC family transcriptional regulator, partial [Pseudonocardia nigra]|uniref:AraC family transcriptional regulator n=1 Tax=Pseudonocardia nigra TaxID=1921578 RepID=UPI001C5CFEB0